MKVVASWHCSLLGLPLPLRAPAPPAWLVWGTGVRRKGLVGMVGHVSVFLGRQHMRVHVHVRVFRFCAHREVSLPEHFGLGVPSALLWARTAEGRAASGGSVPRLVLDAPARPSERRSPVRAVLPQSARPCLSSWRCLRVSGPTQETQRTNSENRVWRQTAFGWT